MAVALDTVTTGTGNGAVNHTASGADRAVYLIYAIDAATITGATYGGTAMTEIARLNDLDADRIVVVYRLVNPATESQATTVTGGQGWGEVAVVSFQGVHQSLPEGTIATATGSSTGPTVDASSEVGGMVLDIMQAFSTPTATAGAGQTERHDAAVNGVQRLGVSTEDGAASVTMSWTLSASNDWEIHAIPIKAALSGGTTFHLDNPVQGSSNAGLLTLTAPTASTSTTGWTVGTTVATRYSRQTYNSEVPATNFTSTAQPSGAPTNSAEDCWRLSAVTTGSFSAGTWYSTVSVIAVSSGGFQDGRARFRIWRSANADGTSATEVTAGTMIGTSVTNLTTSVAQSSSASTQIGALTLTDEFLFLQVAWETV